METIHSSLLTNPKEVKEMEEIYTGIANLGFPIVISVYLLVRIEGKLNQLSESIIELSKTIAAIATATSQ